MINLSSLLPEILVAAATISAAGSFLSTVLAIRTKSHLKKQIHVLAGADGELRRLIEVSMERHLGELEIEQARMMLKKASSSMPKRDREILNEGIEQSSRSGERRFIEGLLAAA